MAVSFPHLLSPLQVGPKRLRNRVLVTAHVPGLAVAGVPGEDYVAYHRARAKGGVGLQVTGATPVHWSSTLGRSNAISNLDDRVIPGYRMLAEPDHIDEAIAFFLLNTKLFPESFNTWDSLGEGYMEAGQTELAISSYEKSLELDPSNLHAAAMIEKMRGE